MRNSEYVKEAEDIIRTIECETEKTVNLIRDGSVISVFRTQKRLFEIINNWTKRMIKS